MGAKTRTRYRLIVHHPRIGFIPRNARTLVAYLDAELAGYASIVAEFLAPFGITITFEVSAK